MSLPINFQPSKQLRAKQAERHAAIVEQESGASTTIESSSSNSPDEGQPAAGIAQDECAPTAEAWQLLVKDGLEVKAAQRRSSGSGGKVLGLDAGQEVVQQ